MDIATILGARPSVSVTEPQADAERAQYLDAAGATTADLPQARTLGKGDTAMTAGAIAMLALAGLVAMRYAFRGALP